MLMPATPTNHPVAVRRGSPWTGQDSGLHLKHTHLNLPKASAGPSECYFNGLFPPVLYATLPMARPPLPCIPSGQISSRFDFQPHPVKTNPHPCRECPFSGPPPPPPPAFWRPPSLGCGKPARRAGARAPGGGGCPTPCSRLSAYWRTSAVFRPRPQICQRARLLRSLNLRSKHPKGATPLPNSRTNLFPQNPPSESHCAPARPGQVSLPRFGNAIALAGREGRSRLCNKC